MSTNAVISASFGRKLTALEVLRGQIDKGHFALAAAYINFAEQFTALLAEAKQQDKANDTKTYTEAVLALGTLDGSQLTGSTIAKWKKIAEEGKELKKNQKHLPSSRDALYFIAQGVEKGAKLGVLGSKGELTAESTITEIKKLFAGGKKKGKGRGTGKTDVRSSPRTVTIGTEVIGFKATPIGLDIDHLPPEAQKLLSNNAVLLRVELRTDPDTNRPTLVAIGYGR
jgi:hypothetical protein